MDLQVRLAQTGAVGAQPLPRLSIGRVCRSDQPPVRGRVIEPSQVHQLMDEHVVAHLVGHQDQTPVETNVTIAAARSPARTLIPHGDPRHRQAVRRRQGEEAWRQFLLRALFQRAALFECEERPGDAGALARNPGQIPPGKRLRLPLRPAARDGDAHASVVIDAQQIPPRTPVPDVIEL